MACGYITTAEFKEITGMNLSDILIDEAIQFGFQDMKKKIFIPREYKTQAKSSRHKLMTPIADLTGDLVITEADLNAYEIDKDYNINQLNSNITGFNTTFGVVDFDANYPSDNYCLVIEYSTAIEKVDKIKIMLRTLNKLIAVNYLFTNVPFSKLQSGISSWNLNGVSITFDLGVMQQVIELNDRKIAALYHDLTPVYTQRTTMRMPTSTRYLQSFKDSLRWS